MSNAESSPAPKVMPSPLRLVFMGTPDFAAAVLRHVLAWRGGTVVAAYCQPDRPAGRGHKMHPPAVKVLALERSIPVYQPLHFREEADRSTLAALRPDLLIVAAYGLILPQTVLDIPVFGPFNVHASLLPQYRGAAPIQRAIMAGDAMTGITIMRMERGLDTGPMVAQRAMGIGLNDTAASMHDELADLGGRLMVEVLEQLAQGTPPTPIPQDDSKATHAAKLTKADGFIHWERPVAEIHARMRGVTPWPGAQSLFLLPGRAPVSVLFQPGEPDVSFSTADHPAPGTITEFRDGALFIACGDGLYRIQTLKPAGGKPLSAEAFWNGYCQQGKRDKGDAGRFTAPEASGAASC